MIQPNSSDFEPYALLLESNKRIKLYQKKYFNRISTCIYLIFAIIVGSLSALFAFDIIETITLTLSSLIAVGVLLFARYFSKRLRSASIIGDSLILKNASKKPFITTLNSVKKARTYNVFSVQCTLLHYHLDGKRHKPIIIGNPPGISIKLDKFFINAKYWSKNKNKRQTISRVL